MSNNLFSSIKDVSLSPAEVADIKSHLSLIKYPLNFAVGLTLDERARIPTISRTNKLFVEDIVDAVDSFPEILPRFMDEQEWETAWELYQQMEDLEIEANQVVQMFRHTKIMVGAMLYKDAREIYQLLKAAYDRGLPGIEAHYHKASKRYEAQRSQGSPAVSDDAPAMEATSGSAANPPQDSPTQDA